MTRPPEARRGAAWDRWCAEMLRRGFTAWQVAQAAGVSETAVTGARHRHEARGGAR